MAIDYSQGRVTVGDRVVALTETGYRLLYELSVNAAQVLTREHLMRRVWSAREAGDAPVVRAYVLRLRKKLGETADDPRYTFNEPRGYGMGPPKENQNG